MSHIVIIGAGIGGTSLAYELRHRLGREHRISLVGDGPRFSFTPSNPWVAVGWREAEAIGVDLAPALARHDIHFIDQPAARVHPARNQVEMGDGSRIDYDYLAIATGPRLAFDDIPGLGPEGHSHSVCTTPHAEEAWKSYQAFLAAPGPIVVGTAPGASCFGPAYETAMIIDADLRKRKLRDRVPMTYVTSEPYIGHMGLAASATPRACSNRNCASATSAGSPTRASWRCARARWTSRNWTGTAPWSNATPCPSPGRW